MVEDSRNSFRISISGNGDIKLWLWHVKEYDKRTLSHPECLLHFWAPLYLCSRQKLVGCVQAILWIFNIQIFYLTRLFWVRIDLQYWILWQERFSILFAAHSMPGFIFSDIVWNIGKTSTALHITLVGPFWHPRSCSRKESLGPICFCRSMLCIF